MPTSGFIVADRLVVKGERGEDAVTDESGEVTPLCGV